METFKPHCAAYFTNIAFLNYYVNIFLKKSPFKNDHPESRSIFQIMDASAKAY